MKQMIFLLCTGLLFGCSSGVSMNLGNPVLTAAVNTPIAIEQSKNRTAQTCEDKTGEAKKLCERQAAEIQNYIKNHQKK